MTSRQTVLGHRVERPGGIAFHASRLMATGQYRIPTAQIVADGVVTATSPVGPYHDASRPEAAAMLERAMDALAAYEVRALDPRSPPRRSSKRCEPPAPREPAERPEASVLGAGRDRSGANHRALQPPRSAW